MAKFLRLALELYDLRQEIREGWEKSIEERIDAIEQFIQIFNLKNK